MKIIHVVGARPNFVKIAPVCRALEKYKSVKQYIVHTGQHYDKIMSQKFFEDLNIPKPDYNLGIGSGTASEQVGKAMIELEKLFAEIRPDIVVVVGDANAVLAAAIPAKKMGFKLAHVEAGLRYGHFKEPEEVNRIMADSVADFLFAPSEVEVKILEKECADKKRIFLAGNVMVDTIFQHRAKAEKSKVLEELGLKPKKYALVTMHRPSNVDDKKNFRELLSALNEIQKKVPVVYPMHPRSRKMLSELGLEGYVEGMKNLILTEPYGYLDFLKLMANAKIVLTDSGGMQEETTALNVPCFLLETECDRPITILRGTNTKVGIKKEKIVKEAMKALNGKPKKAKKIKGWDGKASERIAGILVRGH
ncbi:MAG: UDP-N-acetylglucosamine 2-epimerase (non-hydrolyzing) [archaeon]